jgi:hypothetical protein
MVPHLNDGTPYTPPVAVTFGALLDRYIAEEIPARKSTWDSYTSIIKNHLRPRWENMVLSDIKPALIHSWFQSIKLQPISKGHVRSPMRRLFELATLWEYLPIERRNPVELVKIKGVTKRTKEPVVITHEQFLSGLLHLRLFVGGRSEELHSDSAVIAAPQGQQSDTKIGIEVTAGAGRNQWPPAISQ